MMGPDHVRNARTDGKGAAVLLDLSSQPSAHDVGAKAARLGWLTSQGWPVPACRDRPAAGSPTRDERPMMGPDHVRNPRTDGKGAAVLLDLSSQPSAHDVGAKAARLGWLTSQGWPVPAGVVAPFAVGAALAGTRSVPGLADEVQARLRPMGTYAVRSSANAEDHGTRSFAGQFTSLLDVPGADVVEAMGEVAGSVRAPRAVEYATHVGVDPASLRMAVIVQEMVDATVSGVAFSRNPVDGSDQVVVEAIAGRGERLVGRGLTPQRWVVQDGRAVDRPLQPLVDDTVLEQVVRTVRTIEAATGEPADVEWLWDGGVVHLVQWRPVSSVARAPRVWSSRLAKDMLPGIIPPLVWSVNVPTKSTVIVGLLDRALGPTGLDPATLVRSFGYRAYFDMGALGTVLSSIGLPADALEQMRADDGSAPMRPSMPAMASHGPHLARFLLSLRRWERTVDRLSHELAAQRQALAGVDLSSLSDADLVARVHRIGPLDVRASMLNVVTPLLADVWTAGLRRTARRHGVDPATVEPGREYPEVAALDPAHVLATLDPDDPQDWGSFLDRFGHLSDSPNDCSQPTWAEQPDLLRAALGDPEDGLTQVGRQVSAADLLARVPPWRRPVVSRLWTHAARLRLARERAGYVYARVYGLYRPTFLEVGRRLAERDVLVDPDDVFLLGWDEVQAALAGTLRDVPALVDGRRAEMVEAATLSWPEQIVGDDPVPVRGRSLARNLHGIATAPGRHVGTARVVTHMKDAARLGPGDVLVLEAPDVSWTPLLLRAGAVVTEAGGMLAHASIVAREVGVPCVASVPGATAIPDGSTVSVDGWAGQVLILDPPEAT